MSETKSKAITPGRGGFYGAILGAAITVFLAQKLSTEVEASMTLTLVSVAVGAILGAAIGIVVIRTQKRPA